MAVIQVLLHMLVATAAFQLQLQEVDNVRHPKKIPGFGDIISSAKDAVSNATDAVKDTVSDVTDAVTDTYSDVTSTVGNITNAVNNGTLADIIGSVGDASSKVQGMTDALAKALGQKNGTLGDIIGKVAGAASNASGIMDTVTAIFDQAQRNHSAIFLNLTAASEAAAEAAKMSIAVEELSEQYHELKASAQEAAEASLKQAELVANKTSEAIDASETAFHVLDDKLHHRPTNLTLETLTEQAKEAATEAHDAAEVAKTLAEEHRAKQEEADKYLHETLEAAYKMQAKMNETLSDSATAQVILKARLAMPSATTTTSAATTANDSNETTEDPAKSGASCRLAPLALAMALLSVAPAFSAVGV